MKAFRFDQYSARNNRVRSLLRSILPLPLGRGKLEIKAAVQRGTSSAEIAKQCGEKWFRSEYKTPTNQAAYSKVPSSSCRSSQPHSPISPAFQHQPLQLKRAKERFPRSLRCTPSRCDQRRNIPYALYSELSFSSNHRPDNKQHRLYLEPQDKVTIHPPWSVQL